jgi:RNA polymerase sigma factor for flagellar operon FliA
MNTLSNRKELILKNLRLVNFFVTHLSIGIPSRIDKRDLVCVGVKSLINAAGQYNTSIGKTFEMYAAKLIVRAILDEMHNMDFVPHSIKQVKIASVR